jgi:hypothetical protein
MRRPLLATQLEKATADAAEFKAGFDKAVHDGFEQKAQVRNIACCRPAGCPSLAMRLSTHLSRHQQAAAMFASATSARQGHC